MKKATNWRWMDNGDQTVTDQNTGLTWTQGETELMSWQEALDYCQALVHAGFKDWRLPNRAELQTLLNLSQETAPLINKRFFPAAFANYYWTSEPTDQVTTAFYVSFNSGTTGRRTKKRRNYVRAVRGQATLKGA